MVKEFNSLEDVQKYYDAESNTYIFKEFKEDEKYIRLIIFHFDFNVEANIDAWTICAKDINAKNINTFNIFSQNIHAEDIKANDIKSKDIQEIIDAIEDKRLESDCNYIKQEESRLNN